VDAIHEIDGIDIPTGVGSGALRRVTVCSRRFTMSGGDYAWSRVLNLPRSERGHALIPISVVDLPPGTEESVLQVLRSGMLAQGPKVLELEQEFAKIVGATHAIAVNNGTTALVAALQVLDLKPGDEVITSPFTFVATLNAILESGATATFADIGEHDFNLDPNAVAAQINNRTQVLMPVHLYGQSADMTALTPLAVANDLRMLQDAAQAPGATIGGSGIGTFGLAAFSLYATKNVTSGEGGIITTNDDALADRLRVLRNQGMRERYVYEMAGHNYRMTDLQAAVVVPQLAHLPRITAARQSNAQRLIAGLQDLPGLALPSQRPGRSHVWHQFTVRILPTAPMSRAQFISGLATAGIGSGIYYPKTVFDYPCFKDHDRVRISPVPVAEMVAGQVVSLPVHQRLSESDIDTVIAGVRSLMLGRDR